MNISTSTTRDTEFEIASLMLDAGRLRLEAQELRAIGRDSHANDCEEQAHRYILHACELAQAETYAQYGVRA